MVTKDTPNGHTPRTRTRVIPSSSAPRDHADGAATARPGHGPESGTVRLLWPGTLVLLLITAGLGLYARFVDLGIRPLAVDEYYFITSVRAVHETGLPRLEGGGFYTRGLLPQYITAAFMALLGDGGLAHRLPATLFNLGAIAAAYVYARRHLSQPLALVLPALLLVSSWEVEFARFARMYSALQLATLLLLIAVDRVLAGHRRAIAWIPPAVLLGLLSHIMGIFFLPALALPLLAAWARGESVPGGTRSRAAYLVASAGVAAVGYILVFSDLRNAGVVDPYPPGFEAPGRAMLQIPALGLPAAAGVAVAAVLGLLAYRWIRGTERPTAPELWGWATLLFAAVHALAPFLFCTLVALGRYRDGTGAGMGAEAGVGTGAGTGGEAGVGAGARTGGATRDGSGYRVAVRLVGLAVVGLAAWAALLAVRPGPPSLERAFLGWPNLYDPVVKPWGLELPFLGALLAAGLAGAILIELRRPVIALLRHPGATVLYGVLVLAVIDTLYPTTRYLFFVYPFALLTLLMVAVRLSGPRPAIGVAAVLLLFGISGDFNPTHLVAVSGPEASWRTGRFEPYQDTWYPRRDVVGPADLVNRAVDAGNGRSAVVVAGLPGMSAYLDMPHAIFYARTDQRFVNVSRRRGTVDLWSGERLLSTAEELREWLRGADAAWILAPADEPLPPGVVEAIPALDGAEPAYRSRDGRIRVFQVRRPR